MHNILLYLYHNICAASNMGQLVRVRHHLYCIFINVDVVHCYGYQYYERNHVIQRGEEPDLPLHSITQPVQVYTISVCICVNSYILYCIKRVDIYIFYNTFITHISIFYYLIITEKIKYSIDRIAYETYNREIYL
ncbi:unnamed protein product [Aphis gossypii]|uniref:Uncharacterized protein n=1 Tax=Aphis gossypii TaxID=80765 RepID=A0A9P0IL08_APHGO|nr:unnamed protein product [Aphis gossypii]